PPGGLGGNPGPAEEGEAGEREGRRQGELVHGTNLYAVHATITFTPSSGARERPRRIGTDRAPGGRVSRTDVSSVASTTFISYSPHPPPSRWRSPPRKGTPSGPASSPSRTRAGRNSSGSGYRSGGWWTRWLQGKRMPPAGNPRPPAANG